MITCYKLVEVNKKGAFVGFIVDRGPFCITYKLGQKVIHSEPKQDIPMYPYVFDKLKHIGWYLSAIVSNAAILECTAEELIPIPKIVFEPFNLCTLYPQYNKECWGGYDGAFMAKNLIPKRVLVKVKKVAYVNKFLEDANENML